MMTLSNNEISVLKQKLVAMKKSIEEKQENSLLDESMRESTGDITTGIGNHLAEGNAERVEREQEQTFEQIDEKLLGEIEEALHRIEEGSYGVCVDTGEEIPYERLEALPYAKRTAQAQEKYDQGY
ncbi:TraR/DksA family transcriptional regulator [Bacillus tianshenii]|uniref:TraR/DksA family transcriptional regulator n=1 Tax=Sutcliffiella tianshenii TaxID=1463404 RepID=UPI001CD4C220|nr:TraR/DksA C4-type zinc finger protein [Bacillus tianshenii]MCA1319126.1 TraR/DksA family transcriptional regulator [Bacillus tianshenii]